MQDPHCTAVVLPQKWRVVDNVSKGDRIRKMSSLFQGTQFLLKLIALTGGKGGAKEKLAGVFDFPFFLHLVTEKGVCYLEF